MQDVIEIDGSAGEGGGQVLRTALGLSVVTGRPIRIEHIRGRRKKPGLMRQHLTCVRAAERIGCAEVNAVSVGSTSLDFAPQGCFAGSYRFSVGTAGSTVLVLQCILPALLHASGPSRVVIEGGTHNPMSPPFHFLQRAFLPLLTRMGAKVHAELERPGFFPAGGGRIVVDVEGGVALSALSLVGALPRPKITATATVAGLPEGIARREIKTLRDKLKLSESETKIKVYAPEFGPGNVVAVEVEHEVSGGPVRNLFTAFGEHRRRAEHVAQTTARQAQHFLHRGVWCDEHLCDQLLVPLALAASAGATSHFITVSPAAQSSQHTVTNAALIERFLPVRITFDDDDAGRARCEVAPRR